MAIPFISSEPRKWLVFKPQRTCNFWSKVLLLAGSWRSVVFSGGQKKLDNHSDCYWEVSSLWATWATVPDTYAWIGLVTCYHSFIPLLFPSTNIHGSLHCTKPWAKYWGYRSDKKDTVSPVMGIYSQKGSHADWWQAEVFCFVLLFHFVFVLGFLPGSVICSFFLSFLPTLPFV